MDPNQQPNQAPQPSYPDQPAQPAAPQQIDNYGPQQPMAYDPNYLDSIAPGPAQAKFLSGSFGKIFFAMIGVFVLAVSLIIAFSGKDNTADLQQIAVRLNHMALTAKIVQKSLTSNNLSATNSNFQVWIIGSQNEAEALLGKAGVKKTQYDRTMTANEKSLSDALDVKFENARLNATLGRVYASTMSSETNKMILLFNQMAKRSGAKAIRDYAKTASANLTPIQKSFDDFVDDGN